jgi:hypothetical protein
MYMPFQDDRMLFLMQGNVFLCKNDITENVLQQTGRLFNMGRTLFFLLYFLNEHLSFSVLP